jgi:hypothetical protein
VLVQRESQEDCSYKQVDVGNCVSSVFQKSFAILVFLVPNIGSDHHSMLDDRHIRAGHSC